MKRSGLLSRLWPARRRRPVRARTSPTPVPTWASTPVPTPHDPAAGDAVVAGRLHGLEGELSRLRVLGIAHAAAAASADVRARRAEEQLGAVRAELAALREELVWAFAESRLPVAAATPGSAPGIVVDLRDGAARTA